MTSRGCILIALTARAALAGPPAAGPPAESPQTDAAVAPALRQIDTWIATHERVRSRARVGVCIVDLATGERLYQRRAKEPFKPASNQKLLTSAVALERLGSDFRFTTAVCRRGKDLVLTGDADPTLGDPVLAARRNESIYAELDRWAARVQRLAGEEVTGRLLLRTQIPPEAVHHADWSTRDRSRWYGAPVADLNFHNNCYDVTFVRRPQVGLQPSVSPASRYIRVRDELARGKRHLWRLAAAPADQAVTLKGSINVASRDALSVPCSYPPMLLGRVFLDRLARAGVDLGGRVEAIAATKLDLADAELLAGTRAPLATALHRANKHSLNSAAECLLLRAGDGTWAGSATLMRKTLIDAFGLSESLVVRDGSGLSDGNRVSPGDLATLLTAMSRREDVDVFLGSLARNGVDGTMRRRIAEARRRGRLAAKTGYVAGARALSGYVLDRDGRPALAFSIIVNGTTGGASSLANRIATALIDSQD
ncbi:MAG: D-alanyl-D-alanine carboxypeptidase/D-alanyl-D-alanine-endopeptidase [Planctomycetes bacterium]|jgi:D-alanyl-D-alanine carboxypeptidase/D-alanyl-D-alanine-endopeptidase (penicillin-binding protein 4)|nr:D-alanyl-D-alanine carboxypeptidase/D-alanyl-D-alanine-endopeptidase [Planctomycetota bacterium]